jgi:transcriptional regulator with XRE-family HTH domain
MQSRDSFASRRNARLGSAMKAAGLSFRDLAEKTGCNLKTVQRWYYEGRVPHDARARRIAAMPGTSVGWLWPATTTAHTDELGDHARLFSTLDGEPDLIIQGILMSSRRSLDICSGSSWFLERAVTSAFRYAKKVPLRVLVSPIVTWNGGCLPEELGLHVRTHSGVGQMSLLRGDDAMLVIQSIGMETATAPSLFLSRSCIGGTFDRFTDGFNTMWAQGFDHEFEEASLWQGGTL